MRIIVANRTILQEIQNECLQGKRKLSQMEAWSCRKRQTELERVNAKVSMK